MDKKSFTELKKKYTRELNILLKKNNPKLTGRIMQLKIKAGVLPQSFLFVIKEIRRRKRLKRKTPHQKQIAEDKKKYQALTPIEKRRHTIAQKKHWQKVADYKQKMQ